MTGELQLAIWDTSYWFFCQIWTQGTLETYPRTYSGPFRNMLLFDNSRAISVLFRKWVVSENQSFLDGGVTITPLSV